MSGELNIRLEVTRGLDAAEVHLQRWASELGVSERRKEVQRLQRLEDGVY